MLPNLWIAPSSDIDHSHHRRDSTPMLGMDEADKLVRAAPPSFADRFLFPLAAGACAGASVDLSLFPLDTIKTRLQAERGFWMSGGFSRIYAGILPTLVGSAPNAAAFFLAYETAKSVLEKHTDPSTSANFVRPMLAAMTGEVCACLIRVPVDVVKQRTQANLQSSSIGNLRSTLAADGFKGLYRGYFSTVLREIPFSVIQFPLWELLKRRVAEKQNIAPQNVSPLHSAICGMVSGGTAAYLTTPLDVAKTRIMLATRGSTFAHGNVVTVLKLLYREGGLKGLCAGAVPRTLWISIGGFIFLGGYDFFKHAFARMAHGTTSLDV